VAIDGADLTGNGKL